MNKGELVFQFLTIPVLAKTHANSTLNSFVDAVKKR